MSIKPYDFEAIYTSVSQPSGYTNGRVAISRKDDRERTLLNEQETAVETRRMSSKARPISPSNESTGGIVVVVTVV